MIRIGYTLILVFLISGSERFLTMIKASNETVVNNLTAEEHKENASQVYNIIGNQTGKENFDNEKGIADTSVVDYENQTNSNFQSNFAIDVDWEQNNGSVVW